MGTTWLETKSSEASAYTLNDYLEKLLDVHFAELLKEGYESIPLTSVVEILSGGTPKTGVADYWNNGQIPFLTPGDIGNSPYVLATEKHITESGLNSCNSSLHPTGTVFLTARGTVGKVAIAGRPMAMNQSCFAFSGKTIPQSIVFQLVKRMVCSLRSKANGATFAAINTRDLNTEIINLPSYTLMTSYKHEANTAIELMRRNEEENIKLSNLREVLLPKLMSGEIDVSKVDITQLNNHLLFLLLCSVHHMPCLKS